MSCARQTTDGSCVDSHRHGWGYSLEDGPGTWFKLNQQYQLCKQGHHQSPINIHKDHIPSISDYQLSYQGYIHDVVDNEHTVEFDYEAGSSLILHGKEYQLKQFHFHSPSEHTVEGERYDMEIHFVHQNAKQKDLTVLAVLVKAGQENPLIQSLWTHLPQDKHKHHVFTNDHINVVDLIPDDLEAYYYHGSLTTPPCLETVSWLVLKETIEMSQKQLDYFHKFYNWNIRELQAE